MTETKNKATVACVVLGWNNRQLLKECFDSILNQSYKPLRIVYVDNNSSDNSVAWVKQHYPQVTLLPQTDNTGFAKGNNIGIAAALEDPDVKYVALINTDARLDQDWAAKIIKFAATKPHAAMYQGTTLDYYDHHVIDSTHILLSRWGQGVQGNWRNYYRFEIGPKRVFGVNAAACVITRQFIETQPFKQLFDERFFMYLEDVDLCARAVVLGWDNYLVPGARAYHMGSASSGKTPGLSLYLTFRNNSAVLLKNLPLKTLLVVFPNVIISDFQLMAFVWKKYGVKRSLIVLKGRWLGVLRLPLYLGSRWRIMRRRRVNQKLMWELMGKGY